MTQQPLTPRETQLYEHLTVLVDLDDGLPANLILAEQVSMSPTQVSGMLSALSLKGWIITRYACGVRSLTIAVTGKMIVTAPSLKTQCAAEAEAQGERRLLARQLSGTRHIGSVVASAPIEPVYTQRDPCGRCGVRVRDVGCKHRRVG